jgi:hypothetical protein
MTEFKPGDRVAWDRPDGNIAVGQYLGWTANGQWGDYLWAGSEEGHVVAEGGDPIPQIVDEVFEADL